MKEEGEEKEREMKQTWEEDMARLRQRAYAMKRELERKKQAEHAKLKKAEEGRDGTKYGARSTTNFFTHHLTAISLAIITGGAEAIEKGVNKRSRERARAGGPDGGG